MANKVQVRRGTKTQLTAFGSLAVGEPGYCTDTGELYIGNGSGANTKVSISDAERTTWNSKASTTLATASAAGLMPATDKAKLDGVINPWGDNTRDSRSYVEVGCSTRQTCAAGTITKVLFNTVYGDAKNEYNTGNARFTASEKGTYLISALLGIYGADASTPTRYFVEVQTNGGSGKVRLVDRTSLNASDLSVTACGFIRMNAGEYFEVFVYCSKATTLSDYTEHQMLRVTRIA